jgi:hypothetical protein
MAQVPSYRPINLPANYSIEEGPSPPAANAPPPADLPGPDPTLPG